jgi:LacI family transcriptional regulator
VGKYYPRIDARPVSIKDIARRAGVTPSTVSRALRNNPWIPRRTRDRIKGLAREMGYVPSRSARELAGRKSWTVGACLADLNDAALAEQVKGVDDAAREHGYRLLVALCQEQEQRERECVQDFQERRVDGIVVLGSAARDYLASGPSHFTPIVLATTADDSAKASGYSLGRKVFGRLLHLMQPGE